MPPKTRRETERSKVVIFFVNRNWVYEEMSVEAEKVGVLDGEVKRRK